MRGPSSAPALPGVVAAPGAGCRPHAVSAKSSSASETLRRSGIRRCGLTPQDLTRVHDAVRIEGALHGPHELELHRGGVALELADLEHPDAVLGAEAAAELAHQVVHRAPPRAAHRAARRPAMRTARTAPTTRSRRAAGR